MICRYEFLGEREGREDEGTGLKLLSSLFQVSVKRAQFVCREVLATDLCLLVARDDHKVGTGEAPFLHFLATPPEQSSEPGT